MPLLGLRVVPQAARFRHLTGAAGFHGHRHAPNHPIATRISFFGLVERRGINERIDPRQLHSFPPVLARGNHPLRPRQDQFLALASLDDNRRAPRAGPDGFLLPWLFLAELAFGSASRQTSSAGLLVQCDEEARLARPEVQGSRLPCSIGEEPQPQICVAARGRDAKAPFRSCHSKTIPPNRIMRSRARHPSRRRDLVDGLCVGSLASTLRPCCRATGPWPGRRQQHAPVFRFNRLSHEHAVAHTMGSSAPLGTASAAYVLVGAPTRGNSFRWPRPAHRPRQAGQFRPERRRLSIARRLQASTR